jgi:hypothetical protein
MNTNQPVFMLSVVPDDAFAQDQILKNNKMFESAISHAAAADAELSLVSRVDLNVANGISRAVKELMINKIVLGWNGKITTTNFFFGSIIENLISSTQKMVLVAKMTHPINTISRIVVVTPENAECEAGFNTWLETLRNIASRTSSNLFFTGFKKTLVAVQEIFNENSDGLRIEYNFSTTTHPIADQAKGVSEQDLLVVISARRRTLSFSHYFDHMPRDLARFYENKNFIIIYPEQQAVELQTLSVSLDGVDISPVQENIDRYMGFGKQKRNSPDSRHNSLTE